MSTDLLNLTREFSAGPASGFTNDFNINDSEDRTKARLDRSFSSRRKSRQMSNVIKSRIVIADANNVRRYSEKHKRLSPPANCAKS